MTSTKPSERLFKYPPMERQDLNQSQLGSFKFTPVDPVDNIQSLTQSAKHYLEHQLSQRLPRAPTSSAGPWQDNSSTLSSETPTPQPTSSPADADFFNKHIKPDLGDSRLRLGSAALRFAVDGAASPTKKVSFIQVHQEPDATVNHHRPSNSLSAPQVVTPQFQFATMNPTATAFMPAPELLSSGLSDVASFGQTLCLALANEQRAHTATKAALDQQITQCVELEDQLKKSKQQITSMNITINNLGAIIKHNTSKQNSEANGPHKPTESSEDAEEAALREFYREYQKLKDAAKEREQRKEKEELDQKDPRQPDDSPKEDAAGEVAAIAADEAVDDTQLYNLELLQKPDAGNSAESVLRRTLRKHFSMDSNADDGKVIITPAKQRGSLSKLIDISPESVNGVAEKDNMHIANDQGQVTSLQNGNGQRVISGLTPTQARLPTAEDLLLSLPDKIVSRYGQKPFSEHPQVLKEQSNGLGLTMQHLVKLEALRLSDSGAKPPTDENYGRLSLVSSSAYDDDGQSTPAVASSASAQQKTRFTVQIGDNLHGEPKWIVNKDNPIFDDEQEKWEASGASGFAFRQNSPFHEHPVRYLPEDAAGTLDAYRTVMIDGILDGSTMMDVLTIVKGGSLESIQLFPPIGNATPSMTARVVFNYERSAHNMIQHQEAKAGQDPDANRFKINGVAVRCWMPTDPTYPRNAETEREVFGESHASRIIVVGNIDEYIYNMIPYKIKTPHDKHVIEYSYTTDGCASIEFSDVKSAIKVMSILKNDGNLWTATLQYDDDCTCAPYDQGEPFGN